MISNRSSLKTPPPRQPHDRDEQAFLVDRAPVRALAEAADIDLVAGAGEQGDHLVAVKRRRDDGDVVQMAGAEPGIVGQVMVARLHPGSREFLQEIADRLGHRIDMAGCAGHRLGDHPPARVENAGGKVAGFAHRLAEGRLDQAARLLLDDGRQAVPQHRIADAGQGVVGGPVGHGCSSVWRSSTREPNVSHMRVKPGGTIVEVCASTTIAGPATVSPERSRSRSITAAATVLPLAVSTIFRSAASDSSRSAPPSTRPDTASTLLSARTVQATNSSATPSMGGPYCWR